MRIGLVIEHFMPHTIGGAERSTRELARALAERGNTVAVLTPNYGAAREERDGEVRIFRYWFPRRIEVGRMAPAFWIKNPLYYWISGRAIGRLARRLRLDILHAQNSFVQVPTYFAARRAGLACVATVRDLGSLCSVGHLSAVGYDPDHVCSESFRRCAREFVACYYPRAGLGFRIRFTIDLFFKQVDLLWRQRVLRRYSRVVFVSRGLRDEYLRHGFPVASERLSVVYNLPPQEASLGTAGRPLAEWRLPASGPVVVFLGRMTLGKGADVLLAAIPRVLERHGDAVFVFAGRRSPQVEIPPDIPERNIRLLGQVAHEQVAVLLERASLLVLPSVWPEPLSSAVFEALAAGVPVIGTTRGGTPEQIVEGQNGWLVAPGDPQALADAIARALDDRQALRSMGERCRALLRERFDRRKIVDEMLAIYEAAIAEKRRGGGAQ